MLIFIHVTIAVASIIVSSFTALSPSEIRLRANKLLIAATFITGAYLVVRMHLPLIQACESGLAYLGVTTAALVIGARRLAVVKQRVER